MVKLVSLQVAEHYPAIEDLLYTSMTDVLGAQFYFFQSGHRLVEQSPSQVCWTIKAEEEDLATEYCRPHMTHVTSYQK